MRRLADNFHQTTQEELRALTCYFSPHSPPLLEVLAQWFRISNFPGFGNVIAYIFCLLYNTDSGVCENIPYTSILFLPHMWMCMQSRKKTKYSHVIFLCQLSLPQVVEKSFSLYNIRISKLPIKGWEPLINMLYLVCVIPYILGIVLACTVNSVMVETVLFIPISLDLAQLLTYRKYLLNKFVE